MSRMPVDARTSASDNFAAVMPMAPARSCFHARMGVALWILAWGRKLTPEISHARNVPLDGVQVRQERWRIQFILVQPYFVFVNVHGPGCGCLLGIDNEPAIDQQFSARDVTGLVAQQESYRRGDLVG